MHGCSTPAVHQAEPRSYLVIPWLHLVDRGCTAPIRWNQLFTMAVIFSHWNFTLIISKQNIIFKIKICSFLYNKLFIDNNFLHLYFSTFCLITSMVHIHSYVHGCSSHPILTVLLRLLCFLNEVLLSHDPLQRRQDPKWLQGKRNHS